MLLKEAFDQFEECIGFFGFQDDVFRKETMAGAVAGRIDFAFGGDGAF